MSERESVLVPIGGMGEEREWVIDFDQEVKESCGPEFELKDSKYSDSKSPRPCPHSSAPRNIHRPKETYRNETWDVAWTVPRTVRVHTQGGYDYTSVCLDCILDAASKL